MIYERKAQYYETDQMAIIHHSNYIRWFEESRIEYMTAIGFSYKRIEDIGIQIPVLEVNCNYKSMVKFGDTVEIHLRITEYTGTRMSLEYKIYDKKTGEIRTTGSTKHCFITKEGKVVSLKKAIPAAHKVFLENRE